jgi:hypothetical protein
VIFITIHFLQTPPCFPLGPAPCSPTPSIKVPPSGRERPVTGFLYGSIFPTEHCFRMVNTPDLYSVGGFRVQILETGYPDWGLTWYSLIPPGKCRYSALKLGHDHCLHIISNSPLTYYPFIRCNIVRVTWRPPLNKLQTYIQYTLIFMLCQLILLLLSVRRICERHIEHNSCCWSRTRTRS